MLLIKDITIGFLIFVSTISFVLWVRTPNKRNKLPQILHFFILLLLFSFFEIFSVHLNLEELKSIPPFLFFGGAITLTEITLLANSFQRPRIRIYYAFYFVGIILLGLSVLFSREILFLPSPFSQFPIVLLWITAFIFIFNSLFYLGKSYRNHPAPLYRNHHIFWFGVIILYLLSLVSYFLNQIIVSVVLLNFTFITILYILWKVELPDLGLIARKAISLIIETLAVFLLFTLGIGVVLFATINSNYENIYILLLGSGFLFSLVIYPLVGITRKFIRKRLLQSTKNYTTYLSNYSRKITSLSDLDTLCNHLSELLDQTFEVEHFSLLSATAKDTHIEFQDRINPLASFLFLSKQSPILNYLQDHKYPILQYELDFSDTFAETPEEEKNAVRSFNGEVLIPILFQDEWLGLLIIGAKKSGGRFFEDEILFLQAIADQTAVALKNSLLYEDLLRRNRENEKLNQELSIANKELARLDKAKTDFINIASHELRTPLTQILGYNDFLGEMLQGGAVPLSSIEQMVIGIKKAAKRLDEIISVMLDISKLETQIFEIHPSPVKPAAIIRSAVEKWQNALEERHLTLTISGIQDLPLINADIQRMVQVFSELIQNAIKSTPDYREISIIGKTLPDEVSGQTFIQITIADSGIGIASDDLDKIFEKFYRIGNVLLHSTGNTKFKGAGPGLGLTIAKGIIEAHQGRIWAESLGRDENTLPGSQFHVLLPSIQPNRKVWLENSDV